MVSSFGTIIELGMTTFFFSSGMFLELPSMQTVYKTGKVSVAILLTHYLKPQCNSRIHGFMS